MREEGPDYARVVANQMKALRERAGLNSEAMARALSDELGRRIQLPSVSRWENARQKPKSDVLIAAMRVAGLPLPADSPKDPRRALEQEIEALRRQLEMMARRHGQGQGDAEQYPILPPHHRTTGKYLTVYQAAKRAKVSPETMYQWVRVNRVRGYSWMGRTVVLPEDVDAHSKD